MPHHPSLRYAPVPVLRTSPSGCQIVQGNIQFTGYNYPLCVTPSDQGGFRQRQSSYRYGLVPERTSAPEPTVSGLTFRRPESQINSDKASWLGAQSQRESERKPPHGGDIPDVFGIVEHLREPLEWAETYYPTGPVVPTKTQEVEFLLPPFRPVTLGAAEGPQIHHHNRLQNPRASNLPTQIMSKNVSNPSMTSDTNFTSTAPSSSTSFWSMVRLNEQLPSSITSPTAGTSDSVSSGPTHPNEILVTKHMLPQIPTHLRVRKKTTALSPQMMPRWQRHLLEERDYPSWYDIPGVNKSFNLNGPSIGEAAQADMKPVDPYERPIGTLHAGESVLRPHTPKMELRRICWGMMHTALAGFMGRERDETMVASPQATWLYERESGYNAEEYEACGLPMGTQPQRRSSASDREVVHGLATGGTSVENSHSNESSEISSEDTEEGGVKLDA
ncbi:hypothetical protein L211DRAFT_889750 [Terfezia boudieri ATCC MYA-4762]|uniref:Uncharacterized protein n=1 Tax=Terfezia boudieri ATCC MYA-4762 TaxID=1051890 RepID=A0A3N4LJF4_9PEZI|nr:hypothetical protein L211DRAFT_889750 [Terfezia boudieri ATCC MYA-4762]